MDASLILIPAAAVVAPLAARALGRWVRVPIVVFEIVIGILIGPSLLGWVHPTEFTDQLASLGMAMLFFVAGTEIDFASLRGSTGRRAVAGWLVSLGLGFGIGTLVAPGESGVVIAIALSSTALGAILPILRDAGELKTPFGRSMLAVGAVGEFGPLIAISVFLGSRTPGTTALVLAVFVLAAALVIVLAFLLPRGALHAFVESTSHTSGQFAMRVILLILGALTFLSIALDLDMLLGAFVAGVVWSLLMRDATPANRAATESKLEGVAFGFLIPIFFIHTGVAFDLATLLHDPRLWLYVLLVVGTLLVVRGVPAMLAAARGVSGRDRLSVAFLGATGLPVIVAVTAIGADAGFISSHIATVLVAGGMLTVLLFPLIALTVRGDRVPRRPEESGPSGPGTS